MVFIGAAILFACGNASAQGGNLQFNAAKFIQITFPCVSGACFKDTVVTVPANKVWKIESTGVGTGYTMTLNSAKIQTMNTTSGYQFIYPIWLPAGTYTFNLSAPSSAGIGNGYISAVEFNVVP